MNTPIFCLESSPAANTGAAISLRPLCLEDKALQRVWMRDPELLSMTVHVPDAASDYGGVFSAKDADTYFRSLLYDDSTKTFAILHRGIHVGNVGLKRIDRRGQRAECFIEIGTSSNRRRGVGSAAMALLLDHAFDELQLWRISLGVFEFNVAALALYSRLGFAVTGSYSQHWTKERIWDVVAMSISRDVWRAHSLATGSRDEEA